MQYSKGRYAQQGWVQYGWPRSARPYTLHLRPLQGLLHLADLEVVYRGSTAAEVQVGARLEFHRTIPWVARG